MQYPVDYIWISTLYGPTHFGLDFGYFTKLAGGGKNQPIYAVEDGKVVAIQDGLLNNKKSRTWGNYIFIQHLNGKWTRYAHLEKGTIKVKPGDLVKKGQPIGNMGNSGYSFGNHLHFELYIGGTTLKHRVNPLPHLMAAKGQYVDASNSAIVKREPELSETEQKYNKLLEEHSKLLNKVSTIKTLLQ